MSLDGTPLPYGLRDIKLTAYTDAAGSVLSGTSIDLPNARTLSFADAEEFNELRGDDRVVATHGNGPSTTWELESGGMPFEAFKIMSGGSITETGTTPTQQKIYAKKATDQRPYFKVEGQSISDSGGDVHVVLHRCKATGDLSGEFTDGEFFLTSASGAAIASLTSGATEDELYRFVYNESVTPITMPAPLPIITSITPSGAAAAEVVTIVGDNLTSITDVEFDAIAGTAVTMVSDTVATVKVPVGSSGTVDVVVTTSDGDSAPFSYVRA